MSRLVSASSLNKPPFLVVFKNIYDDTIPPPCGGPENGHYVPKKKRFKIQSHFLHTEIWMKHNYKIDGVVYKQVHL